MTTSETLCACGCGEPTPRATRTSSLHGHVKGEPTRFRRGHRVRAHIPPGTQSEYQTWAGMKSRCQNPDHRAYADYGGRGITVCEEWQTFAGFFTSMGARPEGLTLDRIDNNGPYSPSNCRWANRTEQRNNTRINRHLTLNGRTQTMAEWARERGMNYRTLKTRLNVLGWSVEEALSR